MWGISDAAAHDTGDEICALARMDACAATFDLTVGSVAASCAAAIPNGNHFVAFCYED